MKKYEYDFNKVEELVIIALDVILFSIKGSRKFRQTLRKKCRASKKPFINNE